MPVWGHPISSLNLEHKTFSLTDNNGYYKLGNLQKCDMKFDWR